MKEYIAQFIKSGQVTEDKWIVYRPALKINESTTIGEIVKWAEAMNYPTDDFSIIELHSL